MNTVTICGHQLPIVEHQGQRVVTLAMVDEVHERPEGTAKRNFNENKARLSCGEDYFSVPHSQRYEIRTFGISVPPRGLTLLTESGYLMLVKSLTDDLAWDVQRQLVRNYFRPAAPTELSRLELLEIALASEREKLQAIAERDHAIATKAQIGNKREATAMATASALARENKSLKEELGRSARQATVKAVGNVLGDELPTNAYVGLRRWCKARGIEAADVPDPLHGTVKAWPAGAWMDVHGVDLVELFGEVAA